ncbi:hypothetical protein D3C84_924200 [compost metagenome]
MIWSAIHFTEDPEGRIAFNIANDFTIFVQCCVFLARVAIMTFGNRRHIRVHNITITYNYRGLGVHIRYDMSKCSVDALIGRIEG